MTTRVWFENDAIQMDGLGPFPARSLFTIADGDRIHILTLSGVRQTQLEYTGYARRDGSGFASASEAKDYLDGEFVKYEATAKGADGADGATWAVGQGEPTAQAGPNDLYLDLATGDVYRNS